MRGPQTKDSLSRRWASEARTCCRGGCPCQQPWNRGGCRGLTVCSKAGIHPVVCGNGKLGAEYATDFDEGELEPLSESWQRDPVESVLDLPSIWQRRRLQGGEEGIGLIVEESPCPSQLTALQKVGPPGRASWLPAATRRTGTRSFHGQWTRPSRRHQLSLNWLGAERSRQRQTPGQKLHPR